jgi:hypothetical protein
LFPCCEDSLADSLLLGLAAAVVVVAFVTSAGDTEPEAVAMAVGLCGSAGVVEPLQVLAGLPVPNGERPAVVRVGETEAEAEAEAKANPARSGIEWRELFLKSVARMPTCLYGE